MLVGSSMRSCGGCSNDSLGPGQVCSPSQPPVHRQFKVKSRSALPVNHRCTGSPRQGLLALANTSAQVAHGPGQVCVFCFKSKTNSEILDFMYISTKNFLPFLGNFSCPVQTVTQWLIEKQRNATNHELFLRNAYIRNFPPSSNDLKLINYD